jgi:phage FluMu protein Com
MNTSDKKIPKQIIDKNGKHTTVYVNDGGSHKGKSQAKIIAPIQPSVKLLEPDVSIPEPFSDGRAATHIAYGAVTGQPLPGLAWDGEKLKHQSFDFEKVHWELAPGGYSGAYCSKCGSFFTDVEMGGSKYAKKCAVCSHVNDFTYARGAVAVRDSDRRFFSKSEVRQEKWYHLTTRSDWYQGITEPDEEEQPYVHLGSLDAAKKRMAQLISANGADGMTEDDFYCYEVSISADASIADTVVIDQDSDAPKNASDIDLGEQNGYVRGNDFIFEYESYGVTRYVNEYESHGSISLSAHPSAIEVTKVYRALEL